MNAVEQARGPVKQQFRAVDLSYMALFVTLIAICSWISIPSTVPFTLQTFGVFVSLLMLGGKRGTITVSVYLLLGAVGIPVFSGFSGGLGSLLGSTGGYLIGFLTMTLLYWALEGVIGKKKVMKILVLLLGLAICYAFGTLWFVTVYTSSTGSVGIMTALSWCVFPYIIPDVAKLVLAFCVADRLKAYVQL